MPVEDQRKRCKMLLVEWSSVCNFASKPGMFFILSLDLCYLQIFATITKNVALIFTPYSWDLTCFYCCARSVKKVHGGILFWVMLFITAAIFTSVVDVFLGIEMADAGIHRIEIANLCRFCGRTASCTAPEMIPTPKWSPTLKWSPNRPRNDPDPEMIPTFFLVDPEMIPKELGNGN